LETSALNWRRIWGILRAILGLLLERVVEIPYSDRRSFFIQARNLNPKKHRGLALTSCHSGHSGFFLAIGGKAVAFFLPSKGVVTESWARKGILGKKRGQRKFTYNAIDAP
jgi:hypothetical protein